LGLSDLAVLMRLVGLIGLVLSMSIADVCNFE
jgi:hypothetical protein